MSFSSSSSVFEGEFSKVVPLNLSFEIRSQNEIVLRWKRIGGATGYVIERKEGFSDWEPLEEIVSNSYVDSGLVPGKYYQYRVRGFIDG